MDALEVLEWERRWDENEGEVNISELCREFGVSRVRLQVDRPLP